MVFRAADKDADVIANFEKNVDTVCKTISCKKTRFNEVF